MVACRVAVPLGLAPRVGGMLVLGLGVGLLPCWPAAAGTGATATAVEGKGSVAPARSLCFEQLSGRAGRRDVEQLRLLIEGGQVTGSYFWIPWGKDRRMGRLEGRLAASGTARVNYRFIQEGQRASAPLTIGFNDQKARISWDQPQVVDPSAGPPPPPVTLPKRPCAALQPIPGT